MSAAFFGLAIVAALNPKVLAVDLLLVENRRPRLMFLCLLAGGLGMALAVGLLDVFLLHADAVKTRGSASAGLDVALGVPLLVVGLLLATGHLHGRRRAKAPEDSKKPTKGEGWAQRVLREPRFGLAIAVVLFAIIEFSLIILPYLFLELRPEATKVRLKRAQGWLAAHARQLIAWVAIVAGTYMAISGIVRLS